MTDFTWNISFQLTGTFLDTSLVSTPNVTATVTGTIVTDSDSGVLQQSDFSSWSFTYSAPAVGFAGSASGDQSVLAFAGNVFSASGDALSYVFDPVTSDGPHAFFTDGTSQVAFGIDLAFHDFVQGDIQLQDAFFNKLDATVTQPFPIGREVVATLADVSLIGTSQIDLDLSPIFNVGGDVTISNNDQLVSIDLSNLLSIGGNLTLTENGALLTISLPSLSSVGGDVTISGDTSLTSVNLDNMIGAGGDVTISGQTSLMTIDLSALLQAGAIAISNDGIITLDFSKLVTAGGDVSIADNTHLLTVDLPSLTSVDGSLDVSGDTSAKTIDLGSLSTVNGSVDVTGDTSVTSLDLGSLDTTTGDVTVNSGADATLDASALGPGGGAVKLIGDNLTTTLTLGSLAHMGGLLTVTSADGVTLASHAGLGELDIAGTAHDDTLIGSASANNVINGEGGNDIMTGGAADDTFMFDFSVHQETMQHHDFISLADVTSVTIDDATYFRPAPTASITAWNNWNSELTSWANDQPDNTGGDDFSSFTNRNPGGKHSANTVGTIQLIDGYFHNYTTSLTDVSASGFDTITNFANSVLTTTNGAAGNDVLLFDGLSADPTAANYWGNCLSSTTENGNTTIHIHDVLNNGADVSAITLDGVTTDVASLVNNHVIGFSGASGVHV